MYRHIEVEEIHNNLLQSVSYLVTVENKLIVVDCGDYEKMIKAIGLNREPVIILLTHCHQDHVYGLTKLLDKYPNASVYCSLLTSEGLMDEEQNLSYIIPEYPFVFTHEKQVVIINEGIQYIHDIQIEVLSTPGHSDDCMSYIIGDCIFTGDSYIPFAKVFTKWPRSNKGLAVENEKKITSLIKKRNLNVCCGHWK